MRKTVTIIYAVTLSFLLASPLLAQEKKKAKAEKVSGDVGLLDTEKNYMIVVTKEGKLITLDYNDKTKVTKFVPKKAKMSDINLGQAATISYKKAGDKNIIDSLDVKVKAKKGD
ncbi:MAG: hypothetical protein HY695_25300 [Deltaproteobacteria bacterium]|nr:hypothetical protein [Deltaproteobacteria bacterium]